MNHDTGLLAHDEPLFGTLFLVPDPSSTTTPQPARVLGMFDATCIVVGAIIGVGIFFNPSGVAARTESGTLALAAWALAGGIALCGGLTFAALGRRYNANGAQYDLLRDAYGPCPAFLFVFCNATAIQGGAIGVISLVCATYILDLAGIIVEPRTLSAFAVALVALIAVANIVGVRWGSRVQNATVVAKVLAILGIVALAVFAAPATHPAPAPLDPAATPPVPPLSGFAGVIAALVPAFFAYGGWQHSLWISGEVREPRRNLPRAIMIGVGVVVFVYVAANWAYLTLLGHHGVANSTALATQAVGVVLPPWGSRAVTAAVALSALGVLNAQLLSGPRLVYGMARDGRFFAPFARLHPKFGTPVAAILLLAGTGAVLLVAAGAKGIETLTAGAVFVDGIFFVLTGLALLLLKGGTPETTIPGAKVAASIFILGELGVLVGAFLAPQSRDAAWGGLVWVAVAALIYAALFRARRGHV